MAEYATLAEVKSEIKLVDSDGNDSAFLERLIAASSLKIDNFCHRPAGFIALPVADTRYFGALGNTYLQVGEFIEITTVSVKNSSTVADYTDWASPTNNWSSDGDWIAYARSAKNPDFNPLSRGRPYIGLMIDPVAGSYSYFTSGRRTIASKHRTTLPTVKVLAKWGFAEVVPADIKQACIMLVARWYKRLPSSMADATANFDLGILLYRQRMDVDVAGLLIDGRYVRNEVG